MTGLGEVAEALKYGESLISSINTSVTAVFSSKPSFNKNSTCLVVGSGSSAILLYMVVLNINWYSNTVSRPLMVRVCPLQYATGWLLGVTNSLPQ